MALRKRLKEVSTSVVDRCSRYERTESGQPKIDDIQRHWIDTWAAPYGKDEN